MTLEAPHYNDLYPSGQTIFCFWCGHPNPIPKYYPPPPYFPRSSPHSESGDSDLIPPMPRSDYESDWDLYDTSVTQYFLMFYSSKPSLKNKKKRIVALKIVC